METTDSLIKKALITLSVEQALLELGKPVLDQVTHALYSKYHCYIPDCLDHPDYLKTVIKDLYGNGSSTVIKSIHKHLDEFVIHRPIEQFLIAM